MITTFRIDERLIHGQVAYSWTKAYPSDGLLVIDDKIVNDQIQKQLLIMACPKTMKCFIRSTDKAAILLAKHENMKFFVVAKDPQIALDLLNRGISLTSLNVGGMYYKSGRTQITKTVFVNEDERNILKQLHDKGVYLDGRTTPSDKELDLYQLL